MLSFGGCIDSHCMFLNRSTEYTSWFTGIHTTSISVFVFFSGQRHTLTSSSPFFFKLIPDTSVKLFFCIAWRNNNNYDVRAILKTTDKQIQHAMRWMRIKFTETNYWKQNFKVKKCIFIDLIHSNGTQLLRDLPDFLKKILLNNDRA